MASKEYKLIEVALSNYHFLKDIIEMETEVNNLQGMRYQHTTSEGNNTSDPTEKAALRKIERDKDVLRINVLVNLIDRAIMILPEIEQQTIENYYKNQKNWNEVGRIVNCSVRHCQRKRRKGIRMLISLLSLAEIDSYFSILNQILPDNMIII